jgi:hypothetical protein
MVKYAKLNIAEDLKISLPGLPDDDEGRGGDSFTAHSSGM